MHDATVRLKSGQEYCGPIWSWCPKEGWFSLTDAVCGYVEIQLSDVAEAYKTERVAPGRSEKVDLLERARRDGYNDNQRK